MKVLNVDDRDDNLYFLETVLRATGFEVLNAHNGVEALALLGQNQFDLIVSDVLMPVMDGFQFCREVKKNSEWAKIPFVFYTGSYKEIKDAEFGQQLGATHYLLKPLDPLIIADTLRDIVERSKRGETVPPVQIADENTYLRSYSQRVAHKLDEKIEQYDSLSRRLQSAFDEKVKEVAERLHAEDTLRLSEERYRAVVNSLAEGIITIGKNGSVLTCNDSAAKILGIPKTEIIANSLPFSHVDLIREDGSPISHVDSPLTQCFSTGKSFDDLTIGLVRRDKSCVWVSANVRPCASDLHGKTSMAVISLTDITARRADQEHIEKQARIIDYSHDAIIVCDPKGLINYWNKGAEQLYGWSSEEAVGATASDLFQKIICPETDPVAQALKNGSHEGEFTHVTKLGKELIVQGRFTVVMDKKGIPQSILAFYFDISEKKQLEEKFLRAQRLESIGILAGGVAHDLNNILAPILLAVPIIRMRVNEPQGRMLLDTMEASATRGASIVRQILTFSRGLGTEKVTIQIRHLLKEIAEILQEAFPRDIGIEADLPRALWQVEADTTQLHQVFMNLCVNARDAMPKGGTLTLQAANIEIDKALAASFPDAIPGPYVRASVIDTGTGMPKEMLEKIFEPFFTTKDLGKGTGLGLSTASGIVKQHDGFIDVQSTVGEGTRFDVYLPALRTEEHIAPVMARDLPHGSGELIIVVDDEFALRHICESLLTAHDYRVVLADNGQQGLALLRENHNEAALVITDLLMPGMSGGELIPLLRGLKPTLKIIAISGTVSSSDENMPPTGIIPDAFLNKPFAAEDLLLAVHDVLAERKL